LGHLLGVAVGAQTAMTRTTSTHGKTPLTVRSQRA
jgi:hypothetical protein